jgi:hypothetical protein
VLCTSSFVYRPAQQHSFVTCMPALAAEASQTSSCLQPQHYAALWVHIICSEQSLCVYACFLQAAARNMRSRKEPRQRSSSSGFKALIELGGASAQVTFMPDQQWHGGSSSSSKGQESLRLPLPGASM